MSDALVVFGPDQIDTSRAEMLVRCLNEKIKEKRYKLKKILSANEEKQKRIESMKNEKMLLTTKFNQIDEENFLREKQLKTEQIRIKEFQLNLKILDDHQNSIQRDFHQNQQKFEREKSILIEKFERTKQNWTDVFKPQYEKSRVYQFLKQNDAIYNALVERKEFLMKKRRNDFEEIRQRREKISSEENFRLSIVSLAKNFALRREKLVKLAEIRTKIDELKEKEKEFIESKNDKMKAWENIYNQPVKGDLMDFCLQSNIDQALTLKFSQIQDEISSEPMTPIEERTNSTITFEPIRSSVAHLTTAIDDDDEQLFSRSNRKSPTEQLEKMSIQDHQMASTQMFAVMSNNEKLPTAQPIPIESMSTQELIKPILVTNSNVDSTTTNKSHFNVSFQLAPTRLPSSSIQQEVTSNDVQQMLLTFSPGTSTNNDEVQPMEEEPTVQEQRAAFPNLSSLESTASTQEEFTTFNYIFTFAAGQNDEGANRTLTSPIHFDNWPNLGSPIASNSNDQFSAFLQQTNNGENQIENSFTFSSFDYANLNSGEVSTNETFGAFFFGHSESPINDQSTPTGKQ